MRYFQNAREKGVNSFLAFVLSLLLIFGFYVLTSMPFALYAQFQGVIGEDMSQYQGPLSFALLLFIFSGILFGVIVATKSIHKRPVLSVFTGAPSFRWSHAFRSAGIWFALMAVLEIVSFLYAPQDYTYQFQPGPFLVVLLICLLVLPLQTTAEEVIMRGYLMQQIGLIARTPWIPVLVTSLLFGFMHGANPEIEQYGMAKSMTMYIAMGLFFGIVTVMDDGLEMPIGMHYINNLFAFIIVGYKGSVMEGLPSIFVKESENLTWAAVVTNLIIMVVVLLILKRYFHWPAFNQLFRKFKEPESSIV